jgi:hypothetical protein
MQMAMNADGYGLSVSYGRNLIKGLFTIHRYKMGRNAIPQQVRHPFTKARMQHINIDTQHSKYELAIIWWPSECANLTRPSAQNQTHQVP